LLSKAPAVVASCCWRAGHLAIGVVTFLADLAVLIDREVIDCCTLLLLTSASGCGECRCR
jgi:hypothetical protein